MGKLMSVFSTREPAVQYAAAPLRDNLVVRRPGTGCPAAVQLADIHFSQLLHDSGQIDAHLVAEDLGCLPGATQR
jgi:hypothetical protein